VHADFTPVKTKPTSINLDSSSDEDSSPVVAKRPPLSAKLSQDAIGARQNILQVDTRKEKPEKQDAKGKAKAIGVVKPTNEEVSTKPKPAKSAKPSRAPRTVAKAKKRIETPLPTLVHTPRTSDRADPALQSPPPTRGPATKDEIPDLAVQLFGLDIESSSTPAAPESLQPPSPIDQLVAACDIPSVIPFAELLSSTALRDILPGRARINVKKIGEASYSEVYSINRGKEQVVIKVIPLLPGCADDPHDDTVELPDCSSPQDVLRELEITRTLSSLDGEGFVGFKGCVIEKYQLARADGQNLRRSRDISLCTA
jgi:serine/threonine-protein kinase haspin